MPDYNPDTDPRSSNVLIQSYLLSKGITPGMPGYAQSVRTALNANAANPGLINDYASTLTNEAPPSADATGRPRPRGPAALPTPPIPPLPMAQQDTGNTSAQPTSALPNEPPLPMLRPGANGPDGGPLPGGGPGGGGPGGVPPAPVTPTVGAGIPPPDMSIAQQALLGIPLIGGGYAASKALSAPTVGPGSGQLQIAGPGAAAAPALTGPPPQAQLEGPKPPLMITHDPTATPMLSAPAQPDPLQAALDRATSTTGREPVPVTAPSAPDQGAAPAAGEATAAAPERAAEKVKRVRSRAPRVRAPKI
jgi:hypothetical protein